MPIEIPGQTIQIRQFNYPKRLIARILQHYQLYLLVMPALIYIGIFAYGPMYGIQIAFKDFNPVKGIWASSWIGLENFIRFIKYPDFKKLIINTLSITSYSLATFPCAVGLALMINEIRSKVFKRTIQMVTYAPHFLSTVVVCSLVMMILNKNTGPLNNFLALLNIDRKDFITVPDYFSSIYVWSGVWQNTGWGTVIYLAALANVSPELVEAAKIDGANRIKIIRHVNIPTIIPVILITFILNTGNILSVGFEKIFLLQNSLNLETSRVISTYTYEVGLVGGQFSYSTAIGLFNNVVNVIMLLMVNAASRRLSNISLI